MMLLSGGQGWWGCNRRTFDRGHDRGATLCWPHYPEGEPVGESICFSPEGDAILTIGEISGGAAVILCSAIAGYLQIRLRRSRSR